MKKFFKKHWSKLIWIAVYLGLSIVFFNSLIKSHRLIEEVKVFNELMQEAEKTPKTTIPRFPLN